ncbi:Glutathionyl-hydroquinone reductase YqjG [Linum perenne]
MATSATTFRSFISRDSNSEFPPESGRYHLYVSYACPWASRCLAYLKITCLHNHISFTVNIKITASIFCGGSGSYTYNQFFKQSVKPVWGRTKDEHMGWIFPDSDTDEPGSEPDPLNGAKSIRDLYELASANYTGKYTVPVLWDKKLRTIVNNESAEIIRMLNAGFSDVVELDMYPLELQDRIDETNGWIDSGINSGVYRCGFARNQSSYDQAVKELYKSLDKCEVILSKQRYICGDVLTEADIRLFVTLIRFDEVYAVYFKCNKKLLREYPNLFNYTKDVYQVPGMRSTVNMAHIKLFYYGSHPSMNPFGIIPIGRDIDYSAPHDRAMMPNSSKTCPR